MAVNAHLKSSDAGVSRWRQEEHPAGTRVYQGSPRSARAHQNAVISIDFTGGVQRLVALFSTSRQDDLDHKERTLVGQELHRRGARRTTPSIERHVRQLRVLGAASSPCGG